MPYFRVLKIMTDLRGRDERECRDARHAPGLTGRNSREASHYFARRAVLRMRVVAEVHPLAVWAIIGHDPLTSCRATRRTIPTVPALVAQDPWLEPYADKLAARQAHYRNALQQFDATGGLLGQISQGHHYFGFNRGELYGKPGVWYREWAPAALQLRLIGDFNGWDRWSHPMTRDEFGVWSLFFPDDKYGDKLVHGSRVKVHVVGEDSTTMDRIPAYIRRVVQDERTGDWAGEYWDPPEPYEFKHAVPELKGGLRIYESHVGHGARRSRRSARSRVHAQRPAARRAARLQRRPAHGDPGAPVLRVVRLPRQQLLRRLAPASARRTS